MLLVDPQRTAVKADPQARKTRLRLVQVRHICFREVHPATTTPAMSVPMVSTKHQMFTAKHSDENL